jgi:nucleoside-diphosphate-sugar epimerase
VTREPFDVARAWEGVSHVLITGATGFIGSHLTRALSAPTRTVLCPTRSPAHPLFAELPHLHVLPAAPEEAAPELLAQVQVVFHLAGDARFGDGSEFEAANVALTRRWLSALREAGSKARFVLASSQAAIDRGPDDPCRAPLNEDSPSFPSSDYGRSKVRAEELVRVGGLPWVCLRLPMVYGPNMRPASHLAKLAQLAQEDAWSTRVDFPGKASVLHVSDLVSACLLCAVHPDARDRVLNVADDTPVRFGDLFAALGGRPRWPVTDPVRAALGAARARLPFRLRALLEDALWLDNRRLRALGWAPQTQRAEALADLRDEVAQRLRAAPYGAGWALVTGAAGGLGAALTHGLRVRGRRVIALDRDGAALTEAFGADPHVRCVALDLLDHTAVDAFLGEVSAERPGITAAFLNAGAGARGPFLDLGVQRQVDLLRLNLESPVRLAHALGRGMRQRRGGLLVLLSSTAGFQPLPSMAVYAASKAAVTALGEALWAEFADGPVRVLTVCPAGMSTGFQAAAGVAVQAGEQLLSPPAVAERILAELDQDRCTLRVGPRSLAMDLAGRGLPPRSRARLWRALMKRLR